MQIVAHDTLAAHRAVLAAPVEQREQVFRERVMEPLRGFWAPFVTRFGQGGNQSDEEVAVAMGRMLGFSSHEADVAEAGAALDWLERIDAWNEARYALERAAAAFAAEGRSTGVDQVELAVVLANPRMPNFMELNYGYTGFGGIPGYVMLLVWPTEYNVGRLQPIIAHEFHHNVRGTYAPWRPDVSVAEYLVLEGLAESFAAALYGEDLLGPWTMTLGIDEEERIKPIMRAGLDVTGFNEIRGYIFGDIHAEQMNYRAVGLPPFAGYAVGYRLVQAYLRRTGRTIVEATFTPATEIVAESGYFAD